MSDQELEQLVEQMSRDVKQGADLSEWKKNRKVSPLLSVISNLNSFPKASVETPDLSRVKDQIVNRITNPVEIEKKTPWLLSALVLVARFGLGSIAAILIVISLGMGTAVAALQSLPGQTIYPLKKVVENIQLKLAPKDEVASLQLQFANNRLDELQQVIDQNQQGKISDQETQKIISQTVLEFKQTTSEAAKVAASQPLVVSKFADLTTKLQAASTQTDGQTKAELEQAIQATQLSQQQAIQNIENAGLKVDNAPIEILDSVTASGKITDVTSNSISIGTAKFLLTSDTQYFNVQPVSLKVGLEVDVKGQVKDNKTYATEITSTTEDQLKQPDSGTSTDKGQTTQQTQTTPPPSQDIIVIPDNQ